MASSSTKRKQTDGTKVASKKLKTNAKKPKVVEQPKVVEEEDEGNSDGFDGFTSEEDLGDEDIHVDLEESADGGKQAHKRHIKSLIIL
jgi:hypothetical protein